MTRYYLVPNETDPDKLRRLHARKAPKYPDLIKGNVRGVTDFDDWYQYVRRP